MFRGRKIIVDSWSSRHSRFSVNLYSSRWLCIRSERGVRFIQEWPASCSRDVVCRSFGNGREWITLLGELLGLPKEIRRGGACTGRGRRGRRGGVEVREATRLGKVDPRSYEFAWVKILSLRLPTGSFASWKLAVLYLTMNVSSLYVWHGWLVERGSVKIINEYTWKRTDTLRTTVGNTPYNLHVFWR